MRIPILLSASILVLACGTEDKILIGGGGTATSGGTGDGTASTGTDTGVGATTGDVGGTTGLTIPPGPDNVCADGSEPTGIPGAYPFSTFTVTPETPKSSGVTFNFSCTRCPGGTLGIDGKYKFFEKDDVRSPDPSDWKETWEFFGNRFVNHIRGVDTDGVMKEIVAEGYYFCPDPKELTGYQVGDVPGPVSIDSPKFWNVVIVYLIATPNGPFGIETPVADLSFLGIETIGAADRIGLAVNQFWDPAGTWQNTHQYCRLGTELGGRVCKDPFEE